VVTLAGVVGHRRQTRLLSRAIARGTLPPALLFIGPHGVGKFAVARAAAATLNCLSPPTNNDGLAIDACGTCRSCDRIARALHVDVFTLAPDEKESIKIDVVRDVLSRTGFRPFEGKRRVAIIREADTLEVAAQNALLKSLEEPPPATVFILLSAVPSALLPTVLSRCMRLRFGRLTEREIETVLGRDLEMSTEDARQAASLANGSVGHALALGSTDMAVLRETAMVLVAQTPSAPVASRLQAAAVLSTTPSKKERSREDVGLILQMAASMLRDIELLNAGADAQTLANPGLVDDLQPLQRRYPGDRAREAFAAVDRAIVSLGRPHFAGIKVVCEWLAVRI
jgi:DNA polymerase III subunit delta'